MNVLILGGVAAGTKTAAKLKRENRDYNITILSKSKDISYAGCGLPYYVGGLIPDRAALIVNTPQHYSDLTGVTVHTGMEAVKLNAADKTVDAVNVDTGEHTLYTYDKLVISVGASAAVPPIEGIHQTGIFTMRTPDDAIEMREYIQTAGVKNAVVVGGGFIGLEAAENLQAQGVCVTVVDFAPQILPNIFDPELAAFLTRHLEKEGMRVLTGTKVSAFTGNGTVTGVDTTAGNLPCEMAIMAAGIQPNTAFLADSGLAMQRGAIVVNDKLQTNLADVYAVGDCALVKNRITGAPQWSPMGSSANLEGRTLARSIAGEDVTYPGVLGTGVIKLPKMNAARTGLTEAAAKEAGFDVITVTAVTDDKAHYYPGSAGFITKLIADKTTHRLLGAQVLGAGAVDKMVDIAVMALNMNARLEDFDNADFAYAPPFSTAIHPMVQAVYVLLNKINGDFVSMTPAEYAAGAAADYTVVDMAPKLRFPGAMHVVLTDVTGPLPGVAKDAKLLLVCGRGKNAYFLQNRLRHYGYTNTVVLEGATSVNVVTVPEKTFIHA